MRLWLANRVISAFYALLRWAWKVKIEAEAEEPTIFLFPMDEKGQSDRKFMN